MQFLALFLCVGPSVKDTDTLLQSLGLFSHLGQFWGLLGWDEASLGDSQHSLLSRHFLVCLTQSP